MIINAKFSSTCPACGQAIAVGSEVEWSRGSKAVHVKCPSSGGRRARAIQSAAVEKAAPKRAEPPSLTEAPYVRHEKWAPCKRAELRDTTGDVRVAGAFKRSWAKLRDGAVGEPIVEGDALLVVAQTAFYENAEMNEDAGDMTGPGWQVTLYLRRATGEEAAPELAKAAEKRAKLEEVALRGARVKELRALCHAGWRTSDGDAKLPQGREIVTETGHVGQKQEVAVLSEDGSAVCLYHFGWYDDYRPSAAVTRDPRAVELFLALEGRQEIKHG